MNKVPIPAFAILILTALFFPGCKKDTEPEYKGYDMFPLAIGNMFFYKYSYSSVYYSKCYSIDGFEDWTVISEDRVSDKTNFKIERKLNGLYINKISIGPEKWVPTDTIIISDSINYLYITEDNNSSELTFSLRKPDSSAEINLWSVTLNRYQITGQDRIITIGSAANNTNFRFQTGKGLISYYQFTGLMSSRIRENLVQDSTKIN